MSENQFPIKFSRIPLDADGSGKLLPENPLKSNPDQIVEIEKLNAQLAEKDAVILSLRDAIITTGKGKLERARLHSKYDDTNYHEGDTWEVYVSDLSLTALQNTAQAAKEAEERLKTEGWNEAIKKAIAIVGRYRSTNALNAGQEYTVRLELEDLEKEVKP